MRLFSCVVIATAIRRLLPVSVVSLFVVVSAALPAAPWLPPLVHPTPLAAQHPGEVEGRVVDALTGAGIPGARVVLPASGHEALTAADGAARIRGLPPGEVEVEARRFGYRPARLTVRVRNGRVARFVLPLVPDAVALPGIRAEADPSGARVLDAEAIRTSGARTAGDLLGRMAGVTVVRRGAGGTEEVRMRGGGGEHVLVLVDGISVNDPVTGSADLSSLSAAEVERVEVLPGARTARFGAGAVAGVVLIETRGERRPVHAVARGGSLAERALEVGASREEGSLAASGSARVRRLGGEFQFERDASLGGGTDRRTNADVTQKSLRLELEGGSGPDRWDLRIRGETLERGIPGKSFAPSDSARQSQDGLTATGRWRRRIGSSSTLSAHVHHRLRKLRFRDPAPPLGVPFDERTRLAEWGATVSAELGADDAAGFSPGMSLEWNRRDLAGDALGPSAPPAATDVAASLHADAGPLSLPGRPSASAAVRAHRDGRTGRWLGAHEVALRVRHRALGAHVAHRSSFSPPSSGDLFFREGVGIAPNPDLRAERVRSEMEVGATSRFSLGSAVLDFRLELFAGDLRDMIVWVPDFRFRWSPRNVDVRRRGGEASVEIRHPASGLGVGADFSSVRATYVGEGGTPGVQVVYRPRDSGAVHMDWRRNGWHLGLRSRYTGLRYPVRAAANPLDSFWTLDLTASTDLRLAGWVVAPVVRVERLRDVKQPFIHAFPEPGRTVHFELRIHQPNE